MATDSYPVIDTFVPKSELPEIAQTQSAAQSAISISFGGVEHTVDISAALTVEDVKHTFLSIFGLSKNARIIVKRSSDGAVVIPGPKLPHGSYIIEEIDGNFKKAYKTVVNEHIPAIHQIVTKKHLPFIVESTKAGVSKLKDFSTVATSKSGEGLSLAGTHLSTVNDHLGNGIAVARTQLKSGWAAASEQTSRAVAVAGKHVKGQVQRATLIVNTHVVEKPETWTAKLWLAILSCGAGPISWISGVHVDELNRLLPEAKLPVDSVESAAASVTSIPTEVPLSKAAESFLK